METGPRRSTLPTQLLSMNSRADLYYWNAPCDIWFVTRFMYTAATFLSLCTSRADAPSVFYRCLRSVFSVGRRDKKGQLCSALFWKKSVICLNKAHSLLSKEAAIHLLLNPPFFQHSTFPGEENGSREEQECSMLYKTFKAFADVM